MDLTQIVKQEIEEKFSKSKTQTHVIVRLGRDGWTVHDTDYCFSDTLLISIDTLNRNPQQWINIVPALAQYIKN